MRNSEESYGQGIAFGVRSLKADGRLELARGLGAMPAFVAAVLLIGFALPGAGGELDKTKFHVLACFDSSGRRTFERVPGERCRWATAKELAQLDDADRKCKDEPTEKRNERCWYNAFGSSARPPAWLARANKKCNALKGIAYTKCWNRELDK